MADFTPFYFFDSALYYLLALGAVFRFVERLRLDHCSVSQRSSLVLGVFGVLALYGASRGTILMLMATHTTSTDEGFHQALIEMAAASLFAVLQTLLVTKWVKHVADITMVLQHTQVRWGSIVVLLSTFLLAVSIVLTIAASIDGTNPDRHVSQNMWTTIINTYVGSLYIFNGLCFFGLGMLLRTRWQPSSVADKRSCNRILGIAATFGGMCILRGAVLLFFFDSNRADRINHVMHSNWGVPSILLIELAALAVSLFWLTDSRPPPSATVMDSSQTEPMISQRMATRRALLQRLGGTRRDSGADGVGMDITLNNDVDDDSSAVHSTSSLNMDYAGE